MKKLISPKNVDTILIYELVEVLRKASTNSSVNCMAIKKESVLKLCFIRGNWEWVSLYCLGNCIPITSGIDASVQELIKGGYEIYLFDSFPEYLDKHGIL